MFPCETYEHQARTAYMTAPALRIRERCVCDCTPRNRERTLQYDRRRRPKRWELKTPPNDRFDCIGTRTADALGFGQLALTASPKHLD